jgi:hypothetical protein
MRIAEKHIRHFNLMNGNLVSKRALVKFHAQLKHDIETKRIDAHVPGGVECLDIEKRLAKALGKINGHTMVVRFTPVKYKPNVNVVHTEKGPEVKRKKPGTPKNVKKVEVKPVKKKIKKKGFIKRPQPNDLIEVDSKPSTKKRLSGLSSAAQLAGINFYEHDLGPFKKDFHRMNSDSNVMIWGQPGHGKTVLQLKLAQHLATGGKKVLYVANEEFGKSTLAEKINQFKIGHANLYFVGDLEGVNLNDFDVIFFDSINSLGLTSKDVKALDRKYPNKLFILVVQTTKEGDFRGGRDWEHLVDIAGEVRNRKVILRKNRLDANYKSKSEALMINELVEEKKQAERIKKLVKEQTAPDEPVITT